jgi:NDP-sugar pyrophosphorylase family protein
LRFCANYFDINEDLLVISGDNHIDIDIKNFIRFHQKNKPILTLGLKEFSKEEDVSLFGVAKLDSDLRIRGFAEKPKRGTEPSRMINTSFYLFSPEIRKVLKEMGDTAKDIAGDLIPYLIDNDYPVYGCPIKGYWIDIGTPDSLHRAAMDCLSGKIRHFDRKYQYGPNQWIHPSTLSKIERYLKSGEIELRGNVSIGRNCQIGKGVVIEDSHIGHTSLIDRDTEIKKSMIMSFANIKRAVRINQSIVGRYTTLEDNSVLNADLSDKGRIPVIGENVVLPEDSVVGPGTRVAPLKHRQTILATGRFVELGTDDRNIYFAEKNR